MRGFLLFIVFLVTGFACQSNSEKTGDIQVKEIFIDLDQPVNFKASQFFDTCFIVPLDNRELIGEVSELFLDENHMLITDKRSTQKIYLYDWEGSLIQFLGTEGEGPGNINSSEIFNFCQKTNLCCIAVRQINWFIRNFQSNWGKI
ncbi:6-bladed beta-propeller [Algoriphagus hitonicola]|uniref:6-bladed beta-propeller n=1 Tax=Algoriphagus hitonicola TaxID=435880 RepID=UPI003611865F